LWGAFGAVAPEVFVGLADVYWALGAGRMHLLPRLNALGAGEVAAGALVVLEAAVDEVRADSPAATLLADTLERRRAADLYFSRERRPPGSSWSRVIRPDDNSDAAKAVRSGYRVALVAKALADQNRRDLVHRDNLSRLRALERELEADARAAAAAPTDAGGAAPGDGLRRVATFCCVLRACAAAYPHEKVGAMEAVLHDDVKKERELQNVFFDALKAPDEEHDVVVALKNVRSSHGAPPGVLAVLRTRFAADDTLSTKGLQTADNTDVLTSTFGKLVLVAANTGRTGRVNAALVGILKGFGRNAPDGTMHQLVSYLETTLNVKSSTLLGSVHWSGAALNRRTGQLFRTFRRGRTGFDPLDALAAAHTPPHRRLSSGNPDDDLRCYIRTCTLPRDVDTVPCVIEKLAEARSFKQARAEAAAKAEADAAAARDRAAALTAAAADGPLTEKTFVIGGHGTSSRKRLVGAGAFAGCEDLYADDGELASLLRSRGARVYDLAVEPRSSAIFQAGGSITLCTDSRAIMVLSDGYDRPTGRKPPQWLYCFTSKGKAVKESYVRALADAGFDFDSVELEDHLAYEPGTSTPRAI
jgi:hypothetical protein